MNSIRHWSVVQMNAGTDPDENLNRAINFIEEASSTSSLVALPEFFYVRGDHNTIRQHALTLDSQPIKKLSRCARRNEITLLAGSLPFNNPEEPSQCFNRSLLIDSHGEIKATYDKIHLFDVDLEGSVTVKESQLLSSGSGSVTVDADGLSSGLTICYDLRFPSLFRKYASEGTEAVFVPSNFTAETGRAHWEPLLRARAIENQCYIVAPNQIGPNPETGVESLGQSCIVDPWGNIMTRCSDTEGWSSARIDRDYLRKIRRELPSLDHREYSTGDLR